MIRIVKHLFLSPRFFLLFGGITALFAAGYAFYPIFVVAQTLLLSGIALTLTDIVLLFRIKQPFSVQRLSPRIMSLGSENTVKLLLENLSDSDFRVALIDELPMQFQQRDFMMRLQLTKNEKKELRYSLRPAIRGEYHFGNINVYLRNRIGLAERRMIIAQTEMVPVYPSIIQMKQFELLSVTQIAGFQGIKKMRRLGHSYEFEQIKPYVRGDDYRSINWKATSRRGDLMVNQFTDEKAQQVYSIIDNSRSMRMPFNGFSLLDHAVNTSLVISNVALQKQDKTGLYVFSNKPGILLKAENTRGQLKKILDVLYKVQDNLLEADYELLYLNLRNNIKGRSLLFLYTNFESLYALERVIPVLRKLSSLHLLVCVFFENSEISFFSKKPVENVEGIYTQTIAQQFIAEKKQMVQTLSQFGIQAILTRPEDLSVNTVNKYLELKSRGMI